jgi:prepilin-type N-terminal cleavage/methylation domain-containing protein
LIELLVVIAIIGILAGMLYQPWQRQNRPAGQLHQQPEAAWLGRCQYADDNNVRLPPADFNPEKVPGSGPWQSYFPRSTAWPKWRTG